MIKKFIRDDDEIKAGVNTNDINNDNSNNNDDNQIKTGTSILITMITITTKISMMIMR